MINKKVDKKHKQSCLCFFLFNVRVLFFNNLFRKNIRTFGFKNEQKDENVLKYTFSLRILMK
ncbi:hypothetical protein D3I14_06010 [Enterococcus faecalis]|nr:hypothetical protein HMPREF9514_02261 [Enterococcus faecalis TX0855]EGO8425862.1 hypothetical protein [Enterococcus faecalis]EPH79012.1 hypothetical protein D926_00263 [Enterococcus faecalis D811610-10]EGO8587992.1 hypothetical protein [Enterococcus faecalis]EGO8623604.1 hypothetical protein [Enterococcus faecalis]